MTTSSESFAIPLTTAERYEDDFVPAFFAQWAATICAAAGLRAGDRVLDVGCGTGIVTRTAADLIGSADVVGLDPNDAMLTVARRVRPDLDFRRGQAEDLPFPAAHFDVVLSQMALMFFADRRRALAEMTRVVRPGGTIALLVPNQLARQPGFGPFVAVAARHAGTAARELLSGYFSCGDADELCALLEAAGQRVDQVSFPAGTYRAPSVDAFVRTEVESTPLIERIDEATYARIRADAVAAMAPFTIADGSVSAPFECLLVVARKDGPTAG